MARVNGLIYTVMLKVEQANILVLLNRTMPLKTIKEEME